MLELLKRIDFVLICAMLGLLIMGLLALYSSSYTGQESTTQTNHFLKQLGWIVIGMISVIIVYFIPHRWIYSSAYIFYGISLFFLFLIFFIGKVGLGAERWLQMGPFSFQPSELAKVASVLAVARYISNEETDLNNPKYFLIAGSFLVIPFAMIIRQPDLGTSMVFLAMALPMFYWAGLQLSNLLLIIVPFFVMLASFSFSTFLILMILLVGYLIYSRRTKIVFITVFLTNIIMGLLTPVLWNHLKPYQQNRIKIFLNPESDPRGAGYQIIQSKVAIGSGGALGKGFMQGSQTQLRFLPEQHTDFIFAVIAEEFGFLGAVTGLILFLILIIRSIQIASMVRKKFNSIVIVGITTIIFFHVSVNLGMAVGLLPVTGLPLPFISYGGSSLVTNMIMIGILLNFYRNRFEY
jgi:rod shape determining protein RodA